MSKKLKIAAWAGLLSILLVPPEIYLEHLLDEQPGTQWIFLLILCIYIISVLFTVLLYYGFYLIGKKFNAPFITISSLIIILLNFIWYIFQVFNLQEPIAFYNTFGGVVLIVFGLSRFAFGYGVYKIRNELGKPATSIAILEFVIGLFLVTLVVYFVGLLVSIVVAILQFILLMRLSKSLDDKPADDDVAI